MRIMKFGGTSVATVERLTTVARLVTAGLEREASSASRVVVVASALNGVTDRLAELVDQGESGTVSDPDGWTVDAVEGLRRRHRTLLERVATGRRYRRAAGTIEARLAALARRLRGVALLEAGPAAVRDEILAAGERLSVPIVAAALQERRRVRTDASCSLRRVDPRDLVRRLGSPDLEIDSRIGMTALAVIGTSDTSPLPDTLARDGIAPKGFWAGDRPGSFFAVVDDVDADRAVSSILGALPVEAVAYC